MVGQAADLSERQLAWQDSFQDGGSTRLGEGPPPMVPGGYAASRRPPGSEALVLRGDAITPRARRRWG